MGELVFEIILFMSEWLKNEYILLNRRQLFRRDVKTIGKHFNNVFLEGLGQAVAARMFAPQR